MLEILLSTYNGEKFIKDQLNSLINQSYKNFKIIIRDDGSSDNTIKILNEYKKNFPDLIFLDTDCKKRLGPAKSFLYLLKKSNAKFIMFCDQDDIWLKKKIEYSMDKIKSSENIPTLLFCDLILANKNLKILNKSFIKYKKFDTKNINFKNLCVQNIVTGCTILLNKKAIDLAKKIDLKNPCIMHDHFLAILISYFGKIEFLNKPLVLYRRHSMAFTNDKHSLKKIKFSIKNYKIQCLSLYKITNDEIFKNFFEISKLPKIKRIEFAINNGFLKNSLFKNIFYLLGL